MSRAPSPMTVFRRLNEERHRLLSKKFDRTMTWDDAVRLARVERETERAWRKTKHGIAEQRVIRRLRRVHDRAMRSLIERISDAAPEGER